MLLTKQKAVSHFWHCFYEVKMNLFLNFCDKQLLHISFFRLKERPIASLRALMGGRGCALRPLLWGSAPHPVFSLSPVRLCSARAAPAPVWREIRLYPAFPFQLRTHSITPAQSPPFVESDTPVPCVPLSTPHPFPHSITPAQSPSYAERYACTLRSISSFALRPIPVAHLRHSTPHLNST